MLHRVVAFVGKPPLTAEQVSVILPQLSFENMKRDPYFNLAKDKDGMELPDGAFMRKGSMGSFLLYDKKNLV